MWDRLRVSEFDVERVWRAAVRRVRAVPHATSWRWSASAERNREALAELAGRHRGQRGFLLANGPSLGRMDLEPLEHEITIGLNRIYLLFDRISWRPSYYVSVNDLVLDQFAEEIGAIPGRRFLPWSWRGRFGAPDESLAYVRMALTLGDRFVGDPRLPICSGGTVTFVALQLAYFLGFEEIVIVGLDHSFSVDGTPNAVRERTSAVDADHFHPDYFPPGVQWQLPDLGRSERAYRLARDAYTADGRRILDATDGGHCQVFEKRTYQSLVGRASG